MGRVEQLEERVHPRLTMVAGNKAISDILTQRRFGKSIRRHVLEFGLLFFAILAALGTVGLFIGWSKAKAWGFIGTSVVFLVGGLFLPRALYPVWKGWMALAEKLGAVMTFLLLTIMWVFAVTPMAYLLKLFGVKIIDRTFRLNQESYWETRGEKCSDPERMRRQF